MRILLISPNYALRDAFGDTSDPPLGIASIAAVSLQAGHEVAIVDANAEDLSIPEVVERASDFRPDLVGISCNYAPLHNPTIELAAELKAKLGVFVFAGGNHASALAAYLLDNAPALDAVVQGEGEPVVPLLAAVIEAGGPLARIPGLVLRTPEGIIDTGTAPQIKDLDTLPLPAYDLLPMHKYARYNIMSSRGCPFNCSYCASNVIFSCRVRYRSPERVAAEVRYLLDNFGPRHFWFSDDTFTSNRRYTSRLLDALEALGREFTWSCLTRVSVVDRELLLRMKQTGCTYVSYGIESGSQGMLDAMGKRITVDEIVEALEITAESGLRQYGFFIVGFPGESKETVCETYRLIARTKLDGAAFNVLIPLPGTALMERLLADKLISYDEIEWDRLFARAPDETYDRYPAELASRWTELDATELVEACIVGHALPDVIKCVGE